MRLDEKKRKKSKQKGLWYNIDKRRKAGKRPHKPGEKGYPSAKTWKQLTKESASREFILRSFIQEAILESKISPPLAWGRDLYSSSDEDPRYPGKSAWEIEHFEEFGEWPEIETPDWVAQDDQLHKGRREIRETVASSIDDLDYFSALKSQGENDIDSNVGSQGIVYKNDVERRATDDSINKLIDNWANDFLKSLEQVTVDVQDVVNKLVNYISPEIFSEIMKTIGAKGAHAISHAWHAITHPFIAAWDIMSKPEERAKFIRYLKRAVKHEAIETKLMFVVAYRLATGVKVKADNVKAAMVQFVDIAVKVLLAYIMGPHIIHLFAEGPIKALLSLLSPIDEIVGIALDKPLRAVSKKFLGKSIGILPTSFYEET